MKTDIWEIARMSAGIVVGALISYNMWRYAGGLTGAGHGIYSPVAFTVAPTNYFHFCWPIILAGVASGRKVGLIVGWGLLIIHYGWLIFHSEVFLRLFEDYQRMQRRGETEEFCVWLALYLLLQISVLGLTVFEIRKWTKNKGTRAIA